MTSATIGAVLWPRHDLCDAEKCGLAVSTPSSQTCPNCRFNKMKFDWTAETKPASGLSRGAAADCSHGLRPWKGVVRDEAPEGRKSPRRICRAFGALAR